MSLIDRIFQKVKTSLNTDVRGNISPEEFNIFLHGAIQSRYEEYFYDLNRLITREDRGMVSNYLENLPDRIREKIMYYHKTTALPLVTPSTRTLPVDLQYFDSLELENETMLEYCKDMSEFKIVKSVATSQYPIFTISGTTIRISPDYSGVMSINYLKKPNIPKWTYQVVSGVELFNPSANDFSDADIHPTEEPEIVKRVLLMAGLNLKEQDVQAYVMGQENNEFNQNNAT